MKGIISEKSAFPLFILSALTYILFQDAVREWINAFALEDRVVLLVVVMLILYLFIQISGQDPGDQL